MTNLSPRQEEAVNDALMYARAGITLDMLRALERARAGLSHLLLTPEQQITFGIKGPSAYKSFPSYDTTVPAEDAILNVYLRERMQRGDQQVVDSINRLVGYVDLVISARMGLPTTHSENVLSRSDIELLEQETTLEGRLKAANQILAGKLDELREVA